MRVTAIGLASVAALLLAACGSSATPDYGDEALAEAERANSRVDDLEGQVADLESRLDDLESQLSSEIGDRESATSELERQISSHEHY